MSTAADLVEDVRRAFERGDVDGLRTLVTADAEIRNPFTSVRGPDGFAELARGFTAAFSERRIDVVGLVESGDAAVAQIRVRARHTGSMALPHGEAPATGDEISFEEAGVLRLRDGRIASWHSYYDALELGRQLGIVPAPASR